MRCNNLLRCLALLVMLQQAGPLRADTVATLVIIIDDLGNHLESGLRAVNLPGKVNLAILPQTPESQTLARLSAAAGKEVLLHAPMSNVHGRKLGPGGLTQDMTEEQFRRALAANIEAIPHARGVSNHMGSDLTARRLPMEWLMGELATRDLYFIDSRTSKHTLAATIANEYQIPHLSRQVFLDNKISRDAIHASFQRLLRQADRDGIGIAIGHPYPETMDYLHEVLPTLDSAAYRLALISEVLYQQAGSNQAAALR